MTEVIIIMTRTNLKQAVGGMLLAGLLAVPTFAVPQGYGNAPPPNQQGGYPQQTQAGPPQPGSVNYVEGQATVNGQPVNRNQVGSLALQAGQTIATQNGRAEILLTPGVFFRLGPNSMATMISPDFVKTEVRLDRGRALVEVDGVLKENNIRIDTAGKSVELQEKGLYDFDAEAKQVRVFDGRAAVLAPDREIHVQGGHVVALLDPKLKANGFDKKAYEDDMYRWSSLRSAYLGEANIEMARTYYGGSGWAPSPWVGSGWYWDPWFSAYTWLPGDGLFWSPFGFGFYSPLVVFRAPFIGGFHGQHFFGPGYRPSAAVVHAAAVHNGFAAGGGAHGFAAGGGFHGGFAGGGGFHGGGGGGFHGGHR
jgi:hypothetical protein